jgi:hypothetical protein
MIEILQQEIKKEAMPLHLILTSSKISFFRLGLWSFWEQDMNSKKQA